MTAPSIMQAHTLGLLLTAAATLGGTAAAQSDCAIRFAENSALQVNGDPQPNPDALTAECWLKPSALAGHNANRTAVLKPGSYRMYMDYTGSSSVRFKADFTLENPSNGNQQVVELTSSAFPNGDWQHVALRYDSQFGIARIFVNGQQEQQMGGYAGWRIASQPGQPLSIGWNLGLNRDRWWYGRMDELRIWSTVRTFGEIRLNRHRRIDTAPGLTSAWHFDGDLTDAAGGNTAVDAQVSGSTPPTFASGPVCPGDEFPGTKLDFELETGINGPVNDAGSKFTLPGDTLNASVTSPNGTYTGQPVFWYVELIPTNQQPSNATYEDIWLDLGALSELVSGAPLIPGGLNFQLADYPAIPGFDIWSQAVIFDPSGPNGFVATNLHRLRQPQPVFISPNGSPTGTGTAADPIDSLTAGYNEAKRIGARDVFVASGQYLGETPLFDAPINVIGGLNANNGWNPGPTPSTLRTDHRGLRVRGIQTPITISGLSIIAANGVPSTVAGPDISSMALDVRNCTNDLQFEDCTFEAGNGATGIDGANGANTGITGSIGLGGGDGTADPTSPSGRGGGRGIRGPNDGGRGGDGGVADANGVAGGNGSGAGGGDRGQGGSKSLCGTAQDGNDGSNGRHGANGSNGGSSTAPGGYLNFTGDWFPRVSTRGDMGETGGGGGGAGGGGGMFCPPLAFSGGGGGGGGSGGQTGDPGQPGTEGGASIAVYLLDAEPGFLNCKMIAGIGGNGGAGGNGRRGGTGGGGGPGGNGVADAGSSVITSGAGGQGGRGGDGGGGGAGGAGHGGPSWCVLRAGTSIFNDLNGSSTLTVGSPGLGGAGGRSGPNGNGNSSTAADGLPGPAGAIGTLSQG